MKVFLGRFFITLSFFIFLQIFFLTKPVLAESYKCVCSDDSCVDKSANSPADADSQCKDEEKAGVKCGAILGSCSAAPVNPTKSAEAGGPVDEVRCICDDPKGKSVCIYDLQPKIFTVELESDCAAKIDKNHLNCKIEGGDCKDYNNGGKLNLDSLKNEAKQKLNPVGFITGQKGILELMGRFIAFLMFPIGALAMLMYIWAGFLWMSANADNISKAKSILVWTTLGVIFSLSSYLLVKFVFSNLFG